MAIPNLIQFSQIIAKVESLTRYFSINSEEWYRAFHAKKSVVGSFELFDKYSYWDEHFHLYLPVGSRKHFKEILEVYKSANYVEAKTTVVFSVIDTEEVAFGESGTEFKRVPISGNKLRVVEFNIRSTSPS